MHWFAKCGSWDFPLKSPKTEATILLPSNSSIGWRGNNLGVGCTPNITVKPHPYTKNQNIENHFISPIICNNILSKLFLVPHRQISDIVTAKKRKERKQNYIMSREKGLAEDIQVSCTLKAIINTSFRHFPYSLQYSQS